MVKRFSSEQINGTKNAFFFLSRAPTQRFLYELEQKVRLSETKCGIFHFRSHFLIIKVYILFSKMQGFFDFKTSKLFSILK